MADGGDARRNAAPNEADDVELTEDGVAKTFADEHLEWLRYCHHTGRWFVWAGTRWRENETRLAFQRARELARELSSGAKPHTRAVVGRASFAVAVEKFAQSDQRLAVTSDVWDRDPMLLGTPGGVVELAAGVLRPARREDFITKQTAAEPAARADCLTWLAFLHEATGRDPAVVDFLRRWCGYCLTGSTREHAMMFIYGPGGNGKSVFLNTVAGLLGDYAKTAPMDTFTAARGDRHPTDLAMLRGARMVTATETEQGRAWAEARIKQMTGGDPISARFMRQDFFTFVPAFKLTVAGNHKPKLNNVDEAMRRRLSIIPFMHKPERPDRALEQKLRAEWPAILRWAIEGCMEWQRDGLRPPQQVLDTTADYFKEQDVIGRWFDERCIRDATLAMPPGKLWADLKNWASRNGEEMTDNRKLKPWLLANGLSYRTVHGREMVRGVGLRRGSDRVEERTEGCSDEPEADQTLGP